MKAPAFLGGSAVAQSPTALNERTINWYPEINPLPGAKSQVQLYPTPGVTAFAESLAYSPARGSFYQNGRCFFVLGARLLEVSSVGVITDRGAVAADSTPATLAANGDAGDQLMVVTGGVVYMLNLITNVLTTPSITGTPVQGAYLDGYFLFLDNASTLYKSALFNGSSWDSTDFAQRSAAPDPWKAVAVNPTNKILWLCGEETSEGWYDSGEFPYPFKPIPGGMVPYGIAAAFSIEQIGASTIWLTRTSAGQGQVVLLNGLSPRVVSTPEVETAIAGYATISDALGDTYEERGHTFYVLTFPSANASWVYDLTTNLWHERGTWIVEDSAFDALRTAHHVFAFGKHLVGDRESGAIYEQTLSSATDVEDREIRRLRRGPSICSENRRLFFDSFELLLESGLGLASGQGSDPTVMLRCSNDGGKTWGNELQRSAGAMGQYGTRVAWHRLGSGRDRQFEVTVSDPIPWRLVDAFVTMRLGTEAA